MGAKRITPNFRDRHDVSAGQSLIEQTLAALNASAAVVVLCFALLAGPLEKRGREREGAPLQSELFARPLVPLMLNGAPSDPGRECFPPSILFEHRLSPQNPADFGSE